MNDNEFLLGPGVPRRRRRIRTERSSSPAPSFEVEPTRWIRAASGRLLVENPNICAICHLGRHLDNPHHAFEPDQEYPDIAQRLGWTTPTDQDHIL